MGEEGLEPPVSNESGFTDRAATNYRLLSLIFCTLYRDRTCDLLYVKQPLLPSELRVCKDNTFFLITKIFVIPVRLELTTPPLKVECSKPTELRDLLFVILVTFHNTCFYLFILFSLSERARTSGLSIPNAALYQTELHLVIICYGGRDRTSNGILPPGSKPGDFA